MKSKLIRPVIDRSTFVARTDVINKIRKSIESDEPLCIHVLDGGGGMGKTSILLEILRKPFNSECLVSDIVDFFSSRTKTRRGFVNELLVKLPQTGSAFQPYEQALEALEQKESVSLTTNAIIEEEARLFELFSDCFNKEYASNKRKVILIDTFELVRDSIGDWLLKFLYTLLNVIVIVAGRYNLSWYEKINHEKDVYYHGLHPFTLG